MQPRPSFDRALLIPISIGVVSILGIGWIVLKSGLGQSPIPPTAIPSSSIPLATETLIPSLLMTPTQDEPPPTAMETSPESYPGPPAETLPSTSDLITESPPTASATL